MNDCLCNRVFKNPRKTQKWVRQCKLLNFISNDCMPQCSLSGSPISNGLHHGIRKPIDIAFYNGEIVGKLVQQRTADVRTEPEKGEFSGNGF